MPSILVAFPSADGRVSSLMAASVGNLGRGGFDLFHFPVDRFGIAEARNEMVREAARRRCDYVFMVDSDVVLPGGALTRLSSHNLDVCLGYYVRGTSDDGMTNVLKLYSPNYDGECYSASELEELAKSGVDLVEAKGAGLGCALIRTEVFDRLDKPWFKFVEYPNGTQFGEDYYFCHQCRNARTRVYVDTRVRCGHVHDRVL